MESTSSIQTTQQTQTTQTPAQQSAVPPPQPNLRGVVGLQNMGNTCYANSTLQLLRAVPEWNAFCLRENLEEVCTDVNTVPAKLILAYQDLLRSMWSASRPAYVRPMGFLTIIRDSVRNTVYENFGRAVQNDSHEYMVYLLDNFHEALNERRTPTVADVATTPDVATTSVVAAVAVESTMMSKAQTGWDAFVARNTSPVVDLFFGMIRKTIECSHCKNRSYQWETFNVFKIPCEGTTFQEWVRAECGTTDLEGYECTPCNKAGAGRQNAHIYSHLWRLPSSLFVALRRFQPDGRKIMTPCPPLEGAVTFAEYFAEESDHPSKQWTYECRGIADHHGGHMGGHYSAQTAHPVSNEWWWIDDAMSQPLPSGPRFGSSNYILYFRRVM